VEDVEKVVAAPAVIEARQVDVTWPGAAQPVLSKLDLKIHKGEFVAIVGGVGSGKSSLLRFLAGNMDLAKG
jgi:ABC-type transport system involved in cytochrome bd biosynthesis fused ATPase/permease subunit